MSSLIPINYDSDRQTTSARSLWEFLQVETQYTKWFERMAEYGFTENQDYKAISQKRLTAQGNETTYTDHEITIEMAKEIAMLQRTEKGKQARQYFIELEKQWNSPEAVMVRALKIADKKMLQYENIIKELTPAANLGNAMKNNDGLILVRDFVKILANAGIKIKQTELFSWLLNNRYLYQNSSNNYLPYKKYIDQELFKVHESPIETRSGSFISYTTKITGKGQEYFLNKIKEVYQCQLQ